MVVLKSQRDSHDIHALRLISEQVADEVERLTGEFNLSVVEVLTQAIRQFHHAGQDRQRTGARIYWEALTPEERTARASRASKARWDAERAKKAQRLEDLNTKADPKGSGT